MWEKLPHTIQLLPSKFEFKEKLKPLYAVYDENYLDV